MTTTVTTKSKFAQLNLVERKGVCEIIATVDRDQLEAAVQFGYSSAPVVLIGLAEGGNNAAAIGLLNPALFAAVRSILLPFGWAEQGTVLIAPSEPALSLADLRKVLDQCSIAIRDSIPMESCA